ncbi:hypothetical protein VTJ04DRAFT_7097 [Mycothermus thermophilus]|uniref:uncharacterized protein n=1 Tax=Humicola insolens TaxID=85995 RepID=UPI003742E85A
MSTQDQPNRLIHLRPGPLNMTRLLLDVTKAYDFNTSFKVTQVSPLRKLPFQNTHCQVTCGCTISTSESTHIVCMYSLMNEESWRRLSPNTNQRQGTPTA